MSAFNGLDKLDDKYGVHKLLCGGWGFAPSHGFHSCIPFKLPAGLRCSRHWFDAIEARLAITSARELLGIGNR
jgi:hypothetical protein